MSFVTLYTRLELLYIMSLVQHWHSYLDPLNHILAALLKRWADTDLMAEDPSCLHRQPSLSGAYFHCCTAWSSFAVLFFAVLSVKTDFSGQDRSRLGKSFRVCRSAHTWTPNVNWKLLTHPEPLEPCSQIICKEKRMTMTQLLTHWKWSAIMNYSFRL